MDGRRVRRVSRLGPWSKVSRRAGDRGSRSRDGRRSRSGSARRRTTGRTSSPPPALRGSSGRIPPPSGSVGSSRRAQEGFRPTARLICLRHAEHGDIVHEALRVVDPQGETVGEQVDEGSNLDPVAWSPDPGDHRLLFTSARGPFERPALWDLANGERHDLEIDLPGAVIPVGWWPGGSSILARHEFEGTDQLVRIDPGSRTATLVREATGEILGRSGPAGRCGVVPEQRRHAGAVGRCGRRTYRDRPARRPGAPRKTADPALVRRTERSAGSGVRRDA